MKTWVAGIVLTVGVVLFVGSVIYAIRTFTNRTTPIYVQEVKPGVWCATATTSDGIAISCWREKP